MILITGAAGKTGLAVLHALRLENAAARALIHRPSQEFSVRQAGAQEVVCGDLLDEPTLTGAVQGVRAIYHICPNVHPAEVEIGRRVLADAGRAGLEHFVFHSVLHPQAESMPHHGRKLRVEELVLEANLPYTILQPTAYMQNLLPQVRQMRAEGIYTVPYSPTCRITLVDLEEVAEVAAKILTEEGHHGATYELCGPESLDQHEVAEIFSQELGRSVRAQQTSLESWRNRALAGGLDEARCQTLIAMFQHYDRCGLRGNPNVLRWLLGREPTGLRAFLSRHKPRQ